MGQVSASSGRYDPNVDPGVVNPPAIFEPSTDLTGGVVQLWVAASGGADWGGAVVSVSFDGVNYSNIGTITAPAFQGVLTAPLPNHADPDLVDTLSIDLTESVGILPTSATNFDANARRTLVWLCPAFSTTAPANGELISYGGVHATGTYTSDLGHSGANPSAVLRRGQYGTATAAFSTGDFFTRIDLGSVGQPPSSLIIYDLPTQYIGSSLTVKLQSFNVFGRALEDISTVTAYSYTPTGTGYGGGSGGVPTTPANFNGKAQGSAGNGYNYLYWSPNPSSDHVTGYPILRRVHGVGSYTQIDTASGTNYTDFTAATGITYDYEVEATNSVGNSLPAGPVTLLTN